MASSLPSALRDRLSGLMDEALEYAGPGHFCTGREDSVHVTVRALEGNLEAASPHDPVTRDWQSALDRAAARTRPFDLVFTGVTLTTGGVMAQLEPVDERAWQLMRDLRATLGELAWFEGSGRAPSGTPRWRTSPPTSPIPQGSSSGCGRAAPGRA